MFSKSVWDPVTYVCYIRFPQAVTSPRKESVRLCCSLCSARCRRTSAPAPAAAKRKTHDELNEARAALVLSDGKNCHPFNMFSPPAARPRQPSSAPPLLPTPPQLTPLPLEGWVQSRASFAPCSSPAAKEEEQEDEYNDNKT